jgi:solute carrier family 20 (sodium-dependent phosphate transporter)
MALTWPITADTFTVGAPLPIASVGNNYEWIAVIGGILAFAMAWGIGANDVANAFATSVGAGSVSLRTACLIAAIFELSGAVLLGSQVTDTVRSKIIDPDVFDPLKGGPANGPELLMTAFMCALLVSTIWLVFATYLELPVSTTHSIIGSLVGTALVFRGSSAVNWFSEGSGINKLNGFVGVILSWFISPVLSAFFAVLVFLTVRKLVMRSSNPVKAGFVFFPLFAAFTVTVVIFFIVYKGSPRMNLDKKFSAGQAIGVALGCGAIAAVVSWLFILPLAKKMVDRWEIREKERAKNPDTEQNVDKLNSALAKIGINVDIKENFDDATLAMHDSVEKFDPKAEQLFTWLQVFTASFDSFAHGANDVANAIGPFASIYQLYKSNGSISSIKESAFSKSGNFVGGPLDGTAFDTDDKIPDHQSYCGKVDKVAHFSCKLKFPNLVAGEGSAVTLPKYGEDGVYSGKDATCYKSCAPASYAKYAASNEAVEIWILFLGGMGIVLGLSMWGYRIISAIGSKLTKMTPSRGFSIEVGAAITVIVASRIGLPISTTHCQVGATMGVGLVELKASTVNWRQFAGICVGWVVTVLFTALLSAGIFALLVFSPNAYSQDSLPSRHCPGDGFFVYDEATTSFRGVACSGLTSAQSVRSH